jgi:hypothetical protein
MKPQGTDSDTLRAVRRLGSGEIVYEGYDTAQICENGHVITRSAESDPKFTEDHCSKCGAKTITACGHCGQKIRGYLHGVMPRNYDKPAPKFCHKCGTPYHWTEKGIKAAKELIAEAEKLSPEERESLSKSLDDLVRDTPGTHGAVIRFKKFLPKAGREIADAVRSIVVDIASEAAKKALYP